MTSPRPAPPRPAQAAKSPASTAAQPGTLPGDAAVSLGLNAAIVSIDREQPQILVIQPPLSPEHSAPPPKQWDMLPFGPFSPRDHRTLEIGLRAWVRAQTGLDLGYVDQLYTFGDRGRHAGPGDVGPHIVSIGYLALTEAHEPDCENNARWRSWYHYFPWEDWRGGRPDILTREIEPRLTQWAALPPGTDEPHRALSRAARVRLYFGFGGGAFDDEKSLERYELMYEAGLVAEAARDGRRSARRWDTLPQLGRPMQFDHRRILATAMGRLRGQIKYRPVIFELMPGSFTLLELQKTVEAIAGTHLHKQNFRRLVDQTGLVEPTGKTSTSSRGRPAQLYRFRREAVLERPAPGLRVKGHRRSL